MKKTFVIIIFNEEEFFLLKNKIAKPVKENKLNYKLLVNFRQYITIGKF